MKLPQEWYCLVLLAFFATPRVVFAESDEVLLERVRANAASVALEQASWTLPASFFERELAPLDRQRLIAHWASLTGACLASALRRYAETVDVSLSEMVEVDGTFSLKGNGSMAAFEANLGACIERAMKVVQAPTD